MARVKEDFPESNPSPESISEFEQPSFSPQPEKKFPFPLPVLIGLVLAVIACVVFAMIASSDSRKEVPTCYTDAAHSHK